MGRKRLEQVVVESGALVKVGSDVVLEVEGEEEPCVAQVSHIFVDKKDNAKFSVYWYYFPDDVKRGRQSYHAQDEIFKSDHHQSEPYVSSKTVIWTCTVLSLGKWIAYLGSDANPGGVFQKRGPIAAEPFDIEKDLAACKSLGRPGPIVVKPGKEDVSVGNIEDSKADSKKAKKGDSDEDADDEDDKNRVYMCRHEYMAEKQQWKDEEVPVFCICDLPYNPDKDMVQCSGCGEWYHPCCLQLHDAQVEAINRGDPWTCTQCVDRNATSGQ